MKSYEERIKVVEEGLTENSTDAARIYLHSLNAEYIRFLKHKESIIRQKSQLHWFQEEDANTRYFHALLRGKRRRLFIHRIKDEDGESY